MLGIPIYIYIYIHYIYKANCEMHSDRCRMCQAKPQLVGYMAEERQQYIACAILCIYRVRARCVHIYIYRYMQYTVSCWWNTYIKLAEDGLGGGFWLV